MADLEYGVFDLLHDRIVIEDVAYEYPPDQWKALGAEDSVRGSTVRMLDLTRRDSVVEVHSYKNWYGCADETLTGNPSNYYQNKRQSGQQAWTATWSTAFMSRCMADHLMLLYDLQKEFWISYDDEMSRECALLQRWSGSTQVFLFPTWPIATYRAGNTTGDQRRDVVYAVLNKQGSNWDWGQEQYRLDTETGLLRTEKTHTFPDPITAKYLWRARVRIREINLQPFEMAAHVYKGTVVFEQVNEPPFTERFDIVYNEAPCRDCDNDDRSETFESVVERTDWVGPDSGSQTGTGYSWTNPSRVTTESGSGAVSTGYAVSDDIASGGTTSYLLFNRFVFDVPAVRDTQRIAGFELEVFAQTDGGLHYFDEVRLWFNSEIVGANAVEDWTAVPIAYSSTVFTVTVPEWVYLTTEMLRDGAVSFAMSASSKNDGDDGGYVYVDYARARVLFDDVFTDTYTRQSVGCLETDPLDMTSLNSSALTCKRIYAVAAVTGFALPTASYIHGVELTSLTIGIDGDRSPDTAYATVQVRMRLANGGTYSVWFAKSSQPMALIDHAYRNYIDSTTDLSWGGANDLWGLVNPGCWTPAMVNTYGFQFDIKWDAAQDFQLDDNWTKTVGYSGATTWSAPVSGGGSSSVAWGASGTNVAKSVTALDDLAGEVGVLLAGTITHTFTWVGSGDAPTFVRIKVSSHVKAGVNTNDQRDTTVDGGVGGTGVNDPNSDTKTEDTEVTLTIPVTAGVATFVQTVSAEALWDYPDGLMASAPTALCEAWATSVVDVCTSPQITAVQAKVLYSLIGSLGEATYNAATNTGSMVNPFYGIDGGVLRSASPGGANGAWSVLGNDFRLPTIPANSRVVGIKVTGQYRVTTDYVRGGNMTVKVHIGTYSSGRTGKTLSYPTLSTWADFTLGGSGDYWDYSTACPSSGTYPNATGTQLNTLLKLEIIGDNDPGYVYEFKDLNVELFLIDVCDGL